MADGDYVYAAGGKSAIRIDAGMYTADDLRRLLAEIAELDKATESLTQALGHD